MIQLDKTDQNNYFSTLEINKRYVKKKKNGDDSRKTTNKERESRRGREGIKKRKKLRNKEIGREKNNEKPS